MTLIELIQLQRQSKLRNWWLTTTLALIELLMLITYQPNWTSTVSPSAASLTQPTSSSRSIIFSSNCRLMYGSICGSVELISNKPLWDIFTTTCQFGCNGSATYQTCSAWDAKMKGSLVIRSSQYNKWLKLTNVKLKISSFFPWMLSIQSHLNNTCFFQLEDQISTISDNCP